MSFEEKIVDLSMARAGSEAIPTGLSQSISRPLNPLPWPIARSLADTAALESTHVADNYIRLLTPNARQITTTWREPLAHCLAAAFSSGPWAETPMPLGDAADRNSARGILAELGESAQALLATSATDSESSGSVLGCVIGSALDPNLIDHYGLEPYGARPGDALFAFIGVRPQLQGRRLRPLANGLHQVGNLDCRQYSNRSGTSLASLLFSNWLKLPAIRRCPRIFIRTREVLTPIQALAERNGFQFCGKFYVDFHGHRQDRMVYRRSMT